MTFPLLPVRDMELMFMEIASIQSAGASPILIWTAVLAVGVGDGVGPALLLPAPPPQAVSAAARVTLAQTAILFFNEGLWGIVRHMQVVFMIVVPLLRQNPQLVSKAMCRSHARNRTNRFLRVLTRLLLVHTPSNAQYVIRVTDGAP